MSKELKVILFWNAVVWMLQMIVHFIAYFLISQALSNAGQPVKYFIERII